MSKDYYPFGMVMPGRKYTAGSLYRYGFNGKENDKEVKGDGNQYDYGFRIYDTRLGKFLSVDPLTTNYPWNSPFSYAEGDPINFVDLDGLEKALPSLSPTTTTLKSSNSQIVLYSVPTNKAMCHGPANVGFRMPGYSNPETFQHWADKEPIRGHTYHFLKGAWNLFRHLSAGSKREYGGSEAADDYGDPGQNQKAIEETFDKLRTGSSYERAEILGALTAGSLLGRGSLGKRALTAVEEDGYAIVRDQGGQVAGRGWLSTNGELNLVIKTTGTDLKGRGSDVFRSLYDYINTNFDKIKTIRGRWESGQFSSNLDQFNKFLSEGLTESEAALKTFTGGNAGKLGFNNATILSTSQKNSSGAYTTVDVIFSK